MNEPWTISTATVISCLAAALAGIAVFFAKRVSYTPEDSMTEDQVAQKLKKLYKQVKDLGA